ncbi:hypothetical protein [Muricoccus radiodurans]|uniref:hypothetical protein n=1 Tax=Muricoccus radiodurans TaxID=2231721 RepID=UPI003CF18B36
MAVSLAEAAARLEAAVERLAVAAARPRAAGVPPEQVAALSRRLDETLARLRLALGEGEDELPDEDAEERGA